MAQKYWLCPITVSYCVWLFVGSTGGWASAAHAGHPRGQKVLSVQGGHRHDKCVSCAAAAWWHLHFLSKEAVAVYQIGVCCPPPLHHSWGLLVMVSLDLGVVLSHLRSFSLGKKVLDGSSASASWDLRSTLLVFWPHLDFGWFQRRWMVVSPSWRESCDLWRWIGSCCHRYFLPLFLLFSLPWPLPPPHPNYPPSSQRFPNEFCHPWTHSEECDGNHPTGHRCLHVRWRQ